MLGLPNPANSASKDEAVAIQASNDAVEAVDGLRKRKPGAYEQYSDEVRTKIARYAIDNGVAKTSRRFTADLGKRVSETTVRSMRDAYVNLKKSIGSEPALLTRSPRGAPTILGWYDEMVQQSANGRRVSGWMGRRVYRVPLEHRGLYDALREGGPDSVRQQHTMCFSL